MTRPEPEADEAPQGIAIIGMAGRFPGARDVETLWRNLCEGVESITRLTRARLEAAGVEAPLPEHPAYVPARGLLEDVELFDASFFGISPREAELIDPQQRLFLECAWEALEHAGQEPGRFPGPIGLFAGTGQPGYLLHHVAPHLDTREVLEGLGVQLGNDKDHLTTRAAYKLNLRGPAITVQTACSTSLVAVQLACQALLDYQCDMALAGGSSIAFPVGTGYRYQEGHILSPDGHCRAFDAQAQGTVPGDGVGLVVLKRLEDALEAGDHIHAIILGSAVNNDGSGKVGYSAPAIDGQSEVIQLAHVLAGIDARSVSFVEAHGTGTVLGDAIEVAALTQAFRRTTRERGFCALGSLKSNLGHLNTAAGVASLIKAALALEHRRIPPTLHFTRPHPKLGLEDSPFYVNATARQWPAGSTPRRAGVSSFAMGGTNAHVVLEEAPAREAGSPAGSRQLLVLSARTGPALEAMTERLRAWLERHPEAALADVAYTLQVGRRAFAHRRAVVCGDVAEAMRALAAPSRAYTAEAPEAGRDVAFLFPGQGSQHVDMARALYREEGVFREEVDRCARLLEPHLGLDVRQVLYPSGDAREAAARLERTEWAQPALFTVEYALARLWTSRGVRPAAMLGHSIGEYVAACLADVFTLEDTLALVAARGRLMQALPEGRMLAVPLGEAEVRALLTAELSLAAVNGPESCVVAGPAAEVESLEARLAQRGVASRRLRTSHAFHSGMMEPMLAAFTEQVRRARPRPPHLPWLSNVTGTWVTEAEATDPGYWARHLRQTVRFADGLAELSRRGHVLLEVGPGRTLGALASRQGAPRVFTSLRPSPEQERSDLEHWMEALGQLWAEGVAVDWIGHHAGQRRYRVPLPGYPFERQRYWLDSPRTSRAAPEPARERTLEEVEAELRQSLGIRSVASYPGLEEGLEALCTSAVCEYLRAGGVDIRAGRRYDRKELPRELGVQPRFERLFDAMLAGLAEDGLLRLTDDEVLFLGERPGMAPASEVRRHLETAWPQFHGLFAFVSHCLAHYGRALSGRMEPIGVLYPEGSSRFLQECKARTAEHSHERVYLQLLVEALRRLAAASPVRRLRILEVGGGQGLLTWPLVSTLRGFDIEYHFTDLGRVFVEDARREAERRGLEACMRFGVLDLAREPREQGYEEGTFDVVVAYNVVHATRDVRQSLRHLERLLSPGGTLGLVEAVRIPRWEMLSWGLAEGWWSYEDGLREDSPLLPLSGWERVLSELEFEGVESLPRTEEVRAQVDHGLVLARRRAVATTGAVPPAPVRPAEGPSPSGSRHPRPPLATAYVAPRSELERRIAALCEELLGVAPVGVRDDFFALGGDSLIVLRLTDRLQRELGRVVPPGAAFRGLTVERMAQAIEQVPRPGTSSPLVPLQTQGARPPLFFVHPASGVVFPYFELARRLGPDQPFYGLQALGLDGESTPDESIEDMARHYVQALREVQPQGPYYLGGHSFGCLVAYEMAQQLTAAGQEVGLLALVDEPAPLPGHRPTPLEMARFLGTGVSRTLWPHLHDYFYLLSATRKRHEKPPPAGRLTRLSSALETFLARSALANFMPPDSDSRLLAMRQPAMLAMFQLFLIHLRETFAYEPRASPLQVTLFSTDEVRATRGRREPTMGWATLAAGGVEIHELPGDHLAVLKAPYVEHLAARLSDCLARARAAQPPPHLRSTGKLVA